MCSAWCCVNLRRVPSSRILPHYFMFSKNLQPDCKPCSLGSCLSPVMTGLLRGLRLYLSSSTEMRLCASPIPPGTVTPVLLGLGAGGGPAGRPYRGEEGWGHRSHQPTKCRGSSGTWGLLGRPESPEAERWGWKASPRVGVLCAVALQFIKSTDHELPQCVHTALRLPVVVKRLAGWLRKGLPSPGLNPWRRPEPCLPWGQLWKVGRSPRPCGGV